jgi:hypothetical protein
MRGKDALFSDRFSERKERMEHGKLLTQAEKDSMVQQDKQKKVSSVAFIVLHIGIELMHIARRMISWHL